MALEHEHTVRFHEIDRAGIAYFAQVFVYCHVAFEELLAEVVGDLEAFFRDSAWMAPLVHSEADYAHPMRLGDRLVVALEVEALGARSVTFAYRITGRDDGVLRATARLKHVFVDRAAFASRPVPAEVRAGLARLGLWANSSHED